MLQRVIQIGLVLAASFALFGCGGEGPAGQASGTSVQKFNWKLVTTWPKNLPALGTGPENFARMVDEMSDGRLKIKVYGAGDLIPAFEVFDAVSAGTAEMGHGAAYYWRGKAPIAVMFATVPFGMNAQEMNAWLSKGGGMELWREVYAPYNIIPLACGNSGVQMAGWFNKEINSLDDLNGLKMRIPGIGGEVLKRAGGTPVALPGGEIFTALQTGTIDATEWVGPYNDLVLGLQDVAQYYYYPGWHEPGPTLELLINEEAFNSLPKDLQTIVQTAAAAVNQDMLDEFTFGNQRALKELVEKHNVDLRRLPDDVLAELQRLSADVVSELAQEDELSQRVYDSYMQFLVQVRAYHDISETAYLNAR